MRKLLALVILLAPLCAHAQFAAVNRGPLVGRCNPHTLGIDAVNNDVYECDGSPAQWKLIGSTNGQGGAPFLLRTNSPNCTTLNQLVEYDLSHTDANGVAEVQNALASSKNVIGVVINGAGCSGIATIGTYLSAQCNTDNQSVIGDLVSASASAPGQCDDYGNAVNGAVQTVGRVSKVNTGTGTLSQVDFFLGITAPGSSGGSGVVNPCSSSDSVAYYPLATNAINCDQFFTDNGSGNPTAKSLGLTGTGAGFFYITQGAAPTVSAVNSIYFYAPVSVSSYAWVLPGSAGTGCLQGSNSSGIVTISFTGSSCGSGSGSVTSITASSPIVVTPSPLTTTGVISCPTCSTITTQTNGVNNSSQTTLNLVQGSNVTITNTSGGNVQISSTGGFTFTQISTPTAPTLTNQNAAGSRSITYEVVACEDVNCVLATVPSSTTNIANANASPQVLLSAYGDTLYGPDCFDVYVTADTGGRTTGKIAHCVGKKFIDTGGVGDGTTAPASNNTELIISTAALPGCNIPLKYLTGPDAEPCIETAFNDEMRQTFGAPGDSQDPYWTWGNQQGATASWTGGTISFTTDSLAQAEYLVLNTALPSTPYTFEIFLDALANANSGSGQECFIGLRESSTGKMSTWGITHTQPDSSQTTAGGNMWIHRNWTSNSAQTPVTYIAYQDGEGYFKEQDDGTHVTVSGSHVGDGVLFHQYSTTNLTTAFTTAPSQLIIGGAALTANSAVQCVFDFNRRTQ